MPVNQEEDAYHYEDMTDEQLNALDRLNRSQRDQIANEILRRLKANQPVKNWKLTVTRDYRS